MAARQGGVGRANVGRYAGTQAAGVSASALQSVSAQGSCEVYPLCRPGASNGHAGVYLYLDEVGMLKKLPPVRACALSPRPPRAARLAWAHGGSPAFAWRHRTTGATRWRRRAGWMG